MSIRTANVVGTQSAVSRVSDHRENRSMLKAASPTKTPFLSNAKGRLLEIIKQKSLLKGEFRLASGRMSNYYLDMKPTTFDPEGSVLIAEIIYDMLKDDTDVDSIGGLQLGAVPIVITVISRSWHERPISGFVVRKEKKGHGTDKKIDGNFKPNTTVIIFDDVTTTGGSVLEAVRAVREKGATVKRVITIVDRLEGATENLKDAGVNLVPIFTTQELLS